MVPKGWSVFRLEDIVIRTQLGTTERGMSEDPLTTLIPLIKMGNLGWGSVNFNKVEYIEQSLINDSFLLKKGDFLFNTRNTPDLVGKSAVWDEDYTATFDNNINRIVFNKKVYTNFIAYYLNTGKGKSAIQSLPAGSTSVAAIYWKDLKNIQLLLPSLGEQQKIVQILSTWDKAISVTEKLLTNSQQQKKALMQQLLTGKKRLLDENGVRFIKKWEKTTLGDIAKITTGSSNRQDSSLDGKYTFFDRSEDIRTSSIYLFDGEAIIVPGEGQRFEPKYFIGKFDLHQRTYAIMDFASHSGRFLFYMIDYLKVYFLNQAVGSTVKSLRLPMFQKMTFEAPEIEEQQKIAAVLSAADAEISTLEKKLACLKGEKKALMQQLLTGKRRVVVDVDAA
ncbi:restriction endonuclease subunit S [Escherichia coli]|uniref:restriction endonuclease subunit S n=1 Tax=Escherichia coli TaxID=562 RepID=UPI0021151793|nr:restriction endonuclease subunit S [Escherichia coli]